MTGAMNAIAEKDGSAPVLVIGGGIGGIATAIALGRHGVPVDIVERSTEWTAYGAGITITGPTLRAFRDLGVFEAIVREGFFVDGAHLFRFDGALLTTTAAPPIEPGLPSSGGIMRPALHRIMADTALALGANVRTGTTVVAMTQDQSGVDVRFDDGNEARYALVIGADGIHSQTRTMLFGHAAARPVYTGQVCWRVAARRPADMDVAHFFFGHRHIGGITPCSQDHVYAYVLEPVTAPDRIPEVAQPGHLRDLLRDFGGSMAAVRDAITPFSAIVVRPLEYLFQPAPWHGGRIVLIGDAAHATTPHLASGAGLAVEDAIVLAETLSTESDIPGALASFERRRHDRCRFVVETSAAIAALQLRGAAPEEIGGRMVHATRRMAEPI